MHRNYYASIISCDILADELFAGSQVSVNFDFCAVSFRCPSARHRLVPFLAAKAAFAVRVIFRNGFQSLARCVPRRVSILSWSRIDISIGCAEDVQV